MCGCSKDKKSSKKCKKCKKNCTLLTLYYDKNTRVVSQPISDTYTQTNVGQSASVFSHSDVYGDGALTSKIGIVENNIKILQNATAQPPLIPQVITNNNILFSDGLTSLSYQLFYANNTPAQLPGVYKTICYSSTGLYYDKTCYVTVTIPQVGNLVTIEIKVCDRKSCA